MRYLGMDLGTKTIGLAISDKLGMISSPYKLIRFNDVNDAVNEVINVINKEQVNVLVLGLPKNMNNSLGFASERSMKFKKLLEDKINMEVNLIDERLSTVEAENILLSTDASRSKRKKEIDKVSACIILDTYLRKVGLNGQR